MPTDRIARGYANCGAPETIWNSAIFSTPNGAALNGIEQKFASLEGPGETGEVTGAAFPFTTPEQGFQVKATVSALVASSEKDSHQSSSVARRSARRASESNGENSPVSSLNFAPFCLRTDNTCSVTCALSTSTACNLGQSKSLTSPRLVTRVFLKLTYPSWGRCATCKIPASETSV
jgi:hypothetical protein